MLIDMDNDAPSSRWRDDDVSGTLAILQLALLAYIPTFLSLCAALRNQALFNNMLWFGPGAILGIVLTCCYPLTWRILGLIPPTLCVFIAITLLILNADSCPGWVILVYAASFGCILCSMWRHSELQSRRWTSDAQNNTSWFAGHRSERIVALLLAVVLIIQLAIALTGTVHSGTMVYWANYFLLIVLCLGMITLSIIRFKRHMYEVWVESWIYIMYKIRAHGRGLEQIPVSGPVLVIANHACWWDPLFLASVLPRPITPLMTANFYDIWHLRPFMKHVVHAVRVPEKPIKHEAPEILECIAALDRGECVVICPEGYLRRKEEIPLRRFGRGVYELLKARPDTPVIAAWVEGGWGSWCSWKDGPPTKNKRMDFRRRIDVGFGPAFKVPAEQLENHWPARVFLMNAVSAARSELGLEPLPPFTVEKKDDATPDDSESAEKLPG